MTIHSRSGPRGCPVLPLGDKAVGQGRGAVTARPGCALLGCPAPAPTLNKWNTSHTQGTAVVGGQVSSAWAREDRSWLAPPRPAATSRAHSPQIGPLPGQVTSSGGKRWQAPGTGPPGTTHGGTLGLPGLLQGRWLPGLPGLCGVRGRDVPWTGPSRCRLVSASPSRVAGTPGPELWEKRQRVSRHRHPGPSPLQKVGGRCVPTSSTWLKQVGPTPRGPCHCRRWSSNHAPAGPRQVLHGIGSLPPQPQGGPAGGAPSSRGTLRLETATPPAPGRGHWTEDAPCKGPPKRLASPRTPSPALLPALEPLPLPLGSGPSCRAAQETSMPHPAGGHPPVCPPSVPLKVPCPLECFHEGLAHSHEADW